MLAPQLLQVEPNAPEGVPVLAMFDPYVLSGIEPIGCVDIIDGAMLVLKTSPRIPPIKPRMKPKMNHPIVEVARLTIESISTIAPHILCVAGLATIIIPPSIMTTPNTIPKYPKMLKMLPTFVALEEPRAPPKLEMNEPRKAWVKPPISTHRPPNIDRTVPAIGLSPNFYLSQGTARHMDSYCVTTALVQ